MQTYVSVHDNLIFYWTFSTAETTKRKLFLFSPLHTTIMILLLLHTTIATRIAEHLKTVSDGNIAFIVGSCCDNN